MRTKASLVVATILAAANLAVAQQQQLGDGWTITRFFRVHLRNGNCVDGDLVKRTDREVVLRLGPGEMTFRTDQISKVEYVKMKSYNDPAVYLPKKLPPRVPEVTGAGKPATPSSAVPDALDSADPVPGSISRDAVTMVDQAIDLWKTTAENERKNLTETLAAMGPSVAPYLEFLLMKRASSTPLNQVALALVSVEEERFIDLAPKLMLASASPQREAAVTGLAKATSTRRMSLLLEAMDDSQPTVWKIATDAVLASTLSDTDKRDLADKIAAKIRTSRNNLGLVVALSRLGGQAAHDALWDLVNDNNETNRLVGLHGVGLMANPEDGPRIVGLLGDPSESVKKQVCQTIGKMQYAKAAQDLIRLLDDPSDGLQKNARWALTQVTGKSFADNDAWREWWTSFGSQEERFK